MRVLDGQEKGTGQITGIILAGGKSRRMGKDKALLELDGKPLILRVSEVLEELFDPVIIIADSGKRFMDFSCPVVCDLIPGRGPLGGIYTGLRYAASDAIFVVGCDFPFLDRGLIRYLVGLIPGYDAVVPRCHGVWHPLHAVYSKRCLPVFEQRIKMGELSLRNVLPTLVVREVEEAELSSFDPERVSLTNLNTPEELWQVVDPRQGRVRR